MLDFYAITSPKQVEWIQSGAWWWLEGWSKYATKIGWESWSCPSSKGKALVRHYTFCQYLKGPQESWRGNSDETMEGQDKKELFWTKKEEDEIKYLEKPLHSEVDESLAHIAQRSHECHVPGRIKTRADGIMNNLVWWTMSLSMTEGKVPFQLKPPYDLWF